MPDQHPAGPLPVLLALHGGGGNAGQFQRSAGLDGLADSVGVIVVYPDGTGPIRGILLTWNAGTCCGPAARDSVDDVGFLRRVVTDLATRTSIDSVRIYATGHSNGGMMAWRLAAEAPDFVAAIAPVGGAMVTGVDPRSPVPVLHIHSKDDPRALYEGGLGPPFPGTQVRVSHPPVVRTLETWRRVNRCHGTGETRSGVRWTYRRGEPDHTATLISFEPCATGAPVWHWRLTGAGHGWPGAPRSGPESLLGPRTDVISAPVEIWRFVSRFRLGRPAG